MISKLKRLMKEEPWRKGASLMLSRNNGMGAFYSVDFSFKFLYIAAILVALTSALAAAGGDRVGAIRERTGYVDGRRVNLLKAREEYREAKKELDDLKRRSNAMRAELRDIRRTQEKIERETGLVVKSGLGGWPSADSPPTGPENPNAGLMETVRELKAELQSLDEAVDGSGRRIAHSAGKILSWQDKIDAYPSLLPVSGLKGVGRYGYRLHPILGNYQMHRGVDLDAEYGEPVFSAADGAVTFSERYMGYGRLIKVDHGNGYVTWYAHLSQILAVAGDKVKKGQILGRVGQSGSATGPHLHFEVHLDDAPRNPEHYLGLSRETVERRLKSERRAWRLSR